MENINVKSTQMKYKLETETGQRGKSPERKMER